MGNIALTTFRELVRNRILTLILLFSILLIAFSQVLATLSLGQTNRIIVDFWLAMIELSGLIATIFVGGQILYKEIEWKTLYLILSKPIRRSEFILGKFLGFSAVLFLIVFLQTGVLTGLLWYESIPLDPLVFVAAASIFFKVAIAFAAILFFSTFSMPLLAICFTIGVYIVGHGLAGVLDMAIRYKQVMVVQITQALLVIFPNFEALSVAKNTIGTPIWLPASFFMTNIGLAILYIVILLGFACLIFEKKRFENA